MLKAELWNKSVSRVELDQRARDARVRLERIERQLVLRAASTHSSLRWLLYLFSSGISVSASRESRTRGPLSSRPPRIPQIQESGSKCAVRLVGHQTFRFAILAPDKVAAEGNPWRRGGEAELQSGFAENPGDLGNGNQTTKRPVHISPRRRPAYRKRSAGAPAQAAVRLRAAGCQYHGNSSAICRAGWSAMRARTSVR
jgi:hypothetical protein